MEPGTRPRSPAWFDDAKLGIFVHWTAAAVPAFAPVDRLAVRPGRGGRLGGGDALLALRRVVPELDRHRGQPGGRSTTPRCTATGPTTTSSRSSSPGTPAGSPSPGPTCSRQAGARYVVLVTKHHDGVLLWPSAIPNPHKARVGQSTRDLVGDLAAAVRSRDMRFGTYYSGGLDWTFGGPADHRPRRRCSAAIPQSPEYLAYADAHWHELIERYQPDVLWNDIGYPAAADLDGALRPLLRGGARRRREQPLRLDGPDAGRACTATSSPPSTRPTATRTGSGRAPAASARRSATTGRSPTTATCRRTRWCGCSSTSWPTAATCSSTSARRPTASIPWVQAQRLLALGWWLAHQRRRDLRHPPVDAHRRHDRRGPRRPLHHPDDGLSTPSCAAPRPATASTLDVTPAAGRRPSTSSATTRRSPGRRRRRLRRHPPRPPRRRPARPRLSPPDVARTRAGGLDREPPASSCGEASRRARTQVRRRRPSIGRPERVPS